MTTNKPEVLGYLIRVSGQNILIDHTNNPDGLEKLIRLSDYEALQADRDQQYDMKVKTREQRDAVTTKLNALQAECETLRVAARYSEEVDATPENVWEVTMYDTLRERDELRGECEKMRKDAERLDWIVSEGAIVAHAGVRGEPNRYRVEWPLLGEVGTSWFTSERDAIDAAMQGDQP